MGKIRKFNESIPGRKALLPGYSKISIDGFKLTPAKIEFTISDDDIEGGDFFVDMKDPIHGGASEFIHVLIDDDDYEGNGDYFSKDLGVDVIPMRKRDYEYNKEDATYKKIEFR